MIAEAHIARSRKDRRAEINCSTEKRKHSLFENLVAWLNPDQIANPGDGCGICALAGEARYAGPEVRRVMANHFDKSVQQIALALGNHKSATVRATAILTTIVGAVAVSRSVEDPAKAKAILANARFLVLQSIFFK
jgi:TetR/AcrR family transcriptional regulator, transcriptional repressor for nem operon